MHVAPVCSVFRADFFDLFEPMGLAGKSPSTNDYKAIAGFPASRMGNQTKISGKPIKPSNASTEASAYWDGTVNQLITLQAVTSLDQGGLEKLCFYWGVWKQTERQITIGEVDLSSTSGQRLMTANIRAHDAWRRLAVHFGLTPLARNSVSFQEPSEDDGFLK